MNEALRHAAASWERQPLGDAMRTLAQQGGAWEGTGIEHPYARAFPPFLRWALWQSEGAIGRVEALRTVAAAYREVARQQLERVRVVAPLIASGVLAGGATLLYGLILFVPVVQMLQSLAT